MLTGCLPSSLQVMIVSIATWLIVGAVAGVSVLSAQTTRVGTVYNAVPVARIDPDSPNVNAMLSLVGGAVSMPNGTLVVAQPLEKLLRMFDSTGAFRSVLGRSGKGPGEFESLPAAGRVGDSLYAVDHRTRRLSIFPQAASPSVSIPLPLLRLENAEYAFLEAILANGFAISMVSQSTASTSPVQTLYLHHRDGSQVQQIATFREGDYFAPIKVGPLKLQFPQPLVARPYVVFSPPSGRLVVVRTTVPEAGRAAAVELTWITPAGRTEVQRVAVPVVSVRTSDVDSILVAFSSAMAPALTRSGGAISQRELREKAQNVLVKKSIFPPLERAFMGDDARVWLRIRGQAEWWIVTRGQAVVDRIRLPAKAELLTASGKTVWTQETNDDELPVLVRYVLVKQ